MEELQWDLRIRGKDRLPKRSYTLVYKEDDYIFAEDSYGLRIAEGKAGVDDTSVIQAALTNDYVLITGDFTITQPITLKSKTTIAAYGNAALRLSDGANCSVIEVEEGAYFVKIKGIEIDGNGSAQSETSHGIYVRGTSSNRNSAITIEDCYIHDCRDHGIAVYYTDESVIRRNRIPNNNYGIYLSNSDQNNIENNYVVANNGYSIYLDTCRYCILQNNQVYLNNTGIYVVAGYLNAIKGNSIYYITYSALELDSTTQNIIEGNIINNSNGIFLYFADKNLVKGNMVYDNAIEGIRGDFSSSNLIIGNVCISNRTGIEINYGDYNTIHANVCTDNNEYGINISGTSNYIGKNILRNNGTANLNDTGTSTVKGVYDTTNNIDNIN